MFSRSHSFVYSCIKSESRKLGVRYTAQSKKNRISVQLLKDFPGVGIRGQIVHVKPSTMINKLHPSNGAVYLNFPGAEPAIEVVQPKKNEAPAHIESQEAPSPETNALEEDKQVEKRKYKPEELLSLDQLVNIDLAELVGTDRDVILSKIPKKLIFLRDTEDKELKRPVSVEKIRTTLQNVASKELKDGRLRNSASGFFQGQGVSIVIRTLGDEDNGEGDIVKEIKALGTYQLSIQENGKEVANSTVTIGSRNEK
ncbi:DEKNAAC105605 [Brettanomyces naardenensis]|uniref:DEKNAAC105605 n=1 Tax=Brettanomyces naardenensis TaxID=13370 RepID=A0A448YTP8_BRENA|nr:DEKNAAC105605 [Brettanomyces naardenensis]